MPAVYDILLYYITFCYDRFESGNLHKFLKISRLRLIFLLSTAKTCQNRAKVFFSCLPNLGNFCPGSACFTPKRHENVFY